MNNTIPDALRDFYIDTFWLALSGASQLWCQPVLDPEGGGGTVLLHPRDGAHVPNATWLPRWPARNEKILGYVLVTPKKIEAAFTAILRTNAPSVQVDPGVRRVLHVAEQEHDTAKLDATLADVVLQVAVFGEVVVR